MNKFSLSIVSMIVGFVLGVIVGYSVLKRPEPKPVVPEVRNFHYRLDDSTIVRHTIRGSEGSLEHRIDTIHLLPRVR